MLLRPLSPNPPIINSIISSSSNSLSDKYDSELDTSDSNLQLPIQSVLYSTMMTSDTDDHPKISESISYANTINENFDYDFNDDIRQSSNIDLNKDFFSNTNSYIKLSINDQINNYRNSKYNDHQILKRKSNDIDNENKNVNVNKIYVYDRK